MGVYGVISFGVSQRLREFGIRMALGARRRDVVFMVMVQGVRIAAAGLAIGLAGALALTRLLENLLFGATAGDPMALGAAACVLAIVAVLATLLPARRAALVEPGIALRDQ